MTQIEGTYEGWIGHTVVDESGDKIGKIVEIYTDDETGQPEWLTVKTGLFGGGASFVPLGGARARGDDLMVPYTKDKVKDAPRVEDDGDGYLRPEEEETLYSYYGRQYRRTADDSRSAGSPATQGRSEGYDTSGPTTDDAMTRSEEELRVGTRKQEAGRARLRKYIVTEQVQTTVPVSHEEVRIEREPITDANRDKALSGSDLSEEEHEIILHEEQPVVEKNVVAKERVRLASETVTEDAKVDEAVRKERIETDGDTEARRRA
jgi:uncharacterized protein (TIGR02271 family)